MNICLLPALTAKQKPRCEKVAGHLSHFTLPRMFTLPATVQWRALTQVWGAKTVGDAQGWVRKTGRAEGVRKPCCVLSPAAVRTGGAAAQGCAAPLGSRQWRCQLGLLLAAQASAGGEAPPTTQVANRVLKHLRQQWGALCLRRFFDINKTCASAGNCLKQGCSGC